VALYSVRGFSAATAATADHAIAQLWNPAATDRIRLYECGLFVASATRERSYICRTSTTGTAGSTVTPDADNCWDANKGPDSGALLYLAAFTVQPTKLTPELWGCELGLSGTGGGAGSGYTWTFPDGLDVPAGTGVAMVNATAIAFGASECYFHWGEE